jgi:hypothetical protein
MIVPNPCTQCKPWDDGGCDFGCPCDDCKALPLPARPPVCSCDPDYEQGADLHCPVHGDDDEHEDPWLELEHQRDHEREHSAGRLR